MSLRAAIFSRNRLCFLLLTGTLLATQIVSYGRCFTLNLAWVDLTRSAIRFRDVDGWKPFVQADTQRALTGFSSVLDKFPDNVSAQRGIALALWFGGFPEEAVRLWEATDVARGLSPAEGLMLGWGYEYLLRPNLAEGVWRRFGVPIDYFKDLYWHVRDVEGNSLHALRAAEIIVVLAPNDPENWMRLAQEYENQARPTDAISAWEKAALLLMPTQARYWWAMGRAAYVQNAWPSAVHAFARGLALDPVFREMWRYSYSALYWQEDYVSAVNAALQWVANMPADTEAYVSVGKAYYLNGNDFDANLWLEKALQVNPENAEAQRWLGLVAWRQGDQVEAKRHFGLAIVRNQRYAEAYFDLAQLTMQSGDTVQAIALASQSIAFYPWGCPAPWYVQLGAWYEVADSTEQATAAYQMAVQCDPNLKEAQRALDKMLTKPKP